MCEEVGLDGSRTTNGLSVRVDKMKDVKDMQERSNKAYKDAVTVNNE